MKRRFWVLFLIVLVGFCSFLYMAFYDEAKERAINSLNEQQRLNAKQAVLGIEDYLSDMTNSLNSISRSEDIATLNLSGKKLMEAFYEAHKGKIQTCIRVDPKGRIIYSIPYKEVVGNDISRQKHIREAMVSHKPVVSDVFRAVQGLDMVALHVPVFNKGRYDGTIGIGINFQVIAQRYLEGIQIGKTGYAWMISRDGTELYCPIPGHTGKTVFENCKDFPSILAMAEEMVKGREGVTTYVFDRVRGQMVEGVRKHAVYMPVKVGNTFWSIVVASSEEEVLSSLANFRNRLFWIIGLILLGGGPFSFYGLKAVFIVQEEQKRKRAEEALRESEEKYSAVVQQAKDGVLIIQDNLLQFVNKTMADVLGYAFGEMDNTPYTNYVAPESRATVTARVKARLAGENVPSTYEAKLLRKDGTIIDAELSAAIIQYRGKPADVGIIRDITERKRAEEALRRSEAQANQLAQENAIMAEIGKIIGSTLNIDEVYERFAKEARKLISFDRININLIDHEARTATAAYNSGRSVKGRQVGDVFPLEGTAAEEIIRTHSGLLLHPEDEEELERRLPGLVPAFQAGQRSIMVAPLISKGKVIADLNFSSAKPNSFSDRDLRLAELIGAQIAGAIASAQLFIERKQMEEVLRESEERFRELFDHAPVSYHEINLEGRIARVNRTELEMLGYAHEEMIGQPIWKFNAEEEPARKRVLGKLTGDISPSKGYELTYRRKDGAIISLLAEDRLILDSEGRITGLRGIFQDITDRKQIEKALRKSEERFRELYDHAPLGYHEYNAEGRITSVNRTDLEMLGYTTEEMIGHFIWKFNMEEEVVRQQILDKLAGTLPLSRNLERNYRKKDGTVLPVLIEDRLIFDEKGQIKGIRCAIQDITERKRAEEERQRLEERLSRAEKMEALGTLSGGVAHDLNNVLGVLVGYSELLLMKMGETHSLRSHVSYILQASQKAAAIIQDLLTLARRGVSVSEVLNLNGVISAHLKTPEFEKLKSFHPGVTFKWKLEKELLNIKGSPVHLEKTLMNLLSNAAEAISRSHGEVTLMTENRYLDKPVTGYDDIQEGDYVVLKVSDNGRGISAKDIGKIFEPFYTKKVMGRSGTGLGLAVVWGTLKDHGGYIDVQSEEGKGSTFTLYFPVTRKERVGDQKGVSPESYMGRGESILVVDDVKEQRELATAMLNSLGYRVSAVSSGEEAVTFLKASRVDLLVLDMIMDPGMDGLETYQRVLEINPKQKAVIVSGFSETDRVKKTQEVGAGAYVRKPYIRERIGLAIRGELDRA